ncbi:hypothetical protein [Pedobacter namyangjuensis]|uniref:hypothetical protein n=1 Tax=Pedobacter namyangjuensis TaxID=600626 RepID=UPI000DE20C99|nr:hypothetical protein [Pedobacter namyangjuensis]
MNKIIILLLLPVSILFETEWKRIAIDQKVSLLLPSPIEKLDVDGKEAWYGEIDSAGKCMVMLTDFSKLGLDAKTLATELKKKETYEKLKNGIALGSNSKPTNEEITTFRGYPAYKITMTTEAEGESFDTALLNFFVDAKMYTISVISAKGKSYKTAQQKLINSIIIK